MQKKRTLIFWTFNIFFIIFGLFVLHYYFFRAPVGSKVTTIHISKNQSIDSISSDLEERKVVRSADLLKFLLKIGNSDGQIKIGDYKFDKDLSVFKVAWQIAKNKHNVEPLKITFREGLTNEEMAKILADKMVVFRRDIFLTTPKTKQGYLFPDTYFFYSLTTTDEILEALSSNFENRIKKLQPQVEKSGKPLSEIIIMASIIEKEASGKDDAGIISGILWKRIEKGMPLQADASPVTYKEKGLPDEPICNPGLSSIEASINPIGSPYLFYLHDKNGNVHFAGTYEEHKQNISKYLK